MKEYNLIFVLLDGFRIDKIDLSPQLAKLSKKGVFFSNEITQAPYTMAAMHSIFSGTNPTVNGVDSYANASKFKKDRFKTITQYLKDAGYYCAADVMHESIIPKLGFDCFNPHDEYKEDMFESHQKLISKCLKKGKFFAYLHYSHIHTDLVLNVAKKYNDFSAEYFDDKKTNEANYENAIRKCNSYLKRLDDYLKKNNLFENTIVVIVSDHGSSIGEKKGEKMYGSYVYDYTIKAFSIFIIPKQKPRQIEFQVRHVDILPTIIGLLGIQEDKRYDKFQGKSLLPYFEGTEKQDRIAFSETGGLGGPWPSKEKHNVFSIRAKSYKIIFNSVPQTWELYDLKKDPKEENNIIKKDIPIKMELINLLLDTIEENKRLAN